MSKEKMKLGEGFETKVISKGLPDLPEVPQTRHYVIGWSLISAILGAFGWWFTAPGQVPSVPMQERPGFQEEFHPQKLGGVLRFDVIRAGAVVASYGPYHNTIVNAGETALRDCFINTSCTPVQNFKFHGLGTSAAVVAETQTGCTTELTTQYAIDNTRPTGIQTNNGANIYRTVGTNTVDAVVVIEEFCLMSAASAGTMWSRILTGTVALASGDTLQTTYDLTIE